MMDRVYSWSVTTDSKKEVLLGFLERFVECEGSDKGVAMVEVKQEAR